MLGGAAGQGIQTVEAMLVAVLKSEGYHVFASKEYMSRIRGGSNSTEIRITGKARRAFVRRIDLLLALDAGVVPHLEERITQHTVVLGEREKIGQTVAHTVSVPFARFATEIGHPIYASTIAVGVVLGMLQADEAPFHAYLRRRFARKGEDVVAKNIEAAKKGYAHGVHVCFVEGIEIHIPRPPKNRTEPLLMEGVSALGLGVLAAGCNFVSSYPMSPGTGLLTFLAEHGKDFGVVVDQAEDEIAAINIGLGAWYGGARAIVTTSGGGFSLMSEGVSLSGMIETPIVIHIGQRPGPATGLPTRTEQADLNLALFAGHGEFPRAIFAPGSLAEAFVLAQHAFQIADRYQIPVFILTDQFFLEATALVARSELKVRAVEQHIVAASPDYRRYALTESGISPRSVPGFGSGLVGVDSDEHDETAHITESHTVRVRMHEKRLRKLTGLRKDALEPIVTGKSRRTKTLLVTWGSNLGVAEEALDVAGTPEIAHVHFPQVYPLPESAKPLLAKYRVVVLENNWRGQFADLLEREYKISVTDRILQYDGTPFAVEDVVKKLKSL